MLFQEMNCYLFTFQIGGYAFNQVNIGEFLVRI
jgi:hypothetical protein